MRGIVGPSPFVCARCLRARSESLKPFRTCGRRSASGTSPAPQSQEDGVPSKAPKEDEGQGAMSRRLSEMSEESIETGGRSAIKAVEESGFSEELKSRLLDKIANANFRNEYAAAFAEANMPASAGKGTRDTATAKPWGGQESTEDAALRMLTDSHKPLRVSPKRPVVRGPRGPPSKVDTGRPKNKPGTGARLASAKEKATSYETSREAGLTEREREEFRQGMKMRFHPGARTVMPGTIQGEFDWNDLELL